VLFINHCLNQRYPGEGITTHDTASTASAASTSSTSHPQHFDHTLVLDDVRELCNRYDYLQIVDSVDVICIEEVQFFSHTVDTIRYMVDTLEKHVLCAGLIADYKRQPFGDVLELIPLADEVMHLKALCTVCNDGTPGIFTQRLPSANTSEQVLVGERDTYRSVCRRHYTDCVKCDTITSTLRPLRRNNSWSGRSGGVVPWYVDDVVDDVSDEE